MAHERKGLRVPQLPSQVWTSKPPKLEAGDEFQPVLEYILEACRRYVAFERNAPPAPIIRERANAKRYGAKNTKYLVWWQRDIAQAIGTMFGCVVELEAGSDPVFVGTRVGAVAAAKLYGYAISQIERHRTRERQRHIKLARRRGEGIEQFRGWGKAFMADCVAAFQYRAKQASSNPVLAKLAKRAET